MDIRDAVTAVMFKLKTELYGYLTYLDNHHDMMQTAESEALYKAADNYLRPLYKVLKDTTNEFEFLKNPVALYDVVTAYSDLWFEEIDENIKCHNPPQSESLRDVFCVYFLGDPSTWEKYGAFGIEKCKYRADNWAK